MATKRNFRRRKGASLVEMAVCIILFLMLLFGIVQWSWIFYVENTVASRAARAARVIAMQSDLYMSDPGAALSYAQDLVWYGQSPCLDCSKLAGTSGATIVVTPTNSITTSDSTPVPVGPSLDPPRRQVQVTVSNIQFLDFFGPIITARTITAVQPMECHTVACDEM